MPDIDPAVREHLAAAGRKGAASRWDGTTPEQRTKEAGRALEGRRSAARRISELEERLARVEQQLAAVA